MAHRNTGLPFLNMVIFHGELLNNQMVYLYEGRTYMKYKHMFFFKCKTYTYYIVIVECRDVTIKQIEWGPHMISMPVNPASANDTASGSKFRRMSIKGRQISSWVNLASTFQSQKRTYGELMVVSDD